MVVGCRLQALCSVALGATLLPSNGAKHERRAPLQIAIERGPAGRKSGDCAKWLFALDFALGVRVGTPVAISRSTDVASTSGMDGQDFCSSSNAAGYNS